MSKHKETLIELFKQTTSPHNSANCVHDLLGNRNIILYGAGSGFISFSVFILRKYGLKAYAVLDRKFDAGGAYFNVPAFSPLQYNPTLEEKEKSVVVITVGKTEYHNEIMNCLERMGFRNIVWAHDIYEYHLHYSSMEIEKKGFQYYQENEEKIINCLELFTDD